LQLHGGDGLLSFGRANVPSFREVPFRPSAKRLP
jgi:hypothetical protein